MRFVFRCFASWAVFCLLSTAQAQTWKPRVDPNLSESNWAAQTIAPSGRAAEPSGLTIAHIDANRGLFAVYKSTTGVRVMFSSRYTGRELMSATVQVQNGAAGQVSTVLATRRPTRNTDGVVTIQGIDVVAALAAHKSGKRGGPSVKALKDFAASDTGAAVFEGVAALYLQLGELEHSPRIAALKSPFGLMRTTVEALSGVNGGIDAIDVLASPAAIGAARASCVGNDCQLRGREFMVHDSGFFDVVSGRRMKSDTTPSCSPSPVQRTNIRMDTAITAHSDRGSQGVQPAVFRGNRGAMIKVQAQSFGINDDIYCQVPATPQNDCRGLCGLDCFASIRAVECCGHDRCVRAYGHMACMFGIPSDMPCPACSSLLDAVAAWWRAKALTIEP